MTQLGIVTYNIAKDWDLPMILSLLGQRNICPGRLQGPRGAPPRPPRPSYTSRELFALLAAQHYEGFTLAEIPESTDPERVLRYFKALWLSYQPGV
ncbi:MAG TPA: hypothetical protein VJY33_21900, partial [Isosphaeraceae bacterium]|nr:hypothetical protein [Isosphaeraceae bacterium]